MARKRMFDIEVVDTDLFLDMPQSTQNLYFHLGMRADDDGFVSNPKKIARVIGANEDDLRILFSKQFIIPFDSGVIVIRHWKLNNFLRKDRHTDTIYVEEKKQLVEDENGVYNLNSSQNELLVNQTVTIGQPRKEKNRIEKNSIYNNNNIINLNGQNEVKILDKWEGQFEEFYKNYPRKVKKQDTKKWFEKNKPSDELFESIMTGLNKFKESDDWIKENGKYIPHPSTWLNKKRWDDEDIDIHKGRN